MILSLPRNYSMCPRLTFDVAEHPVRPGVVRTCSNVVNSNLLVQSGEAIFQALDPPSNLVDLGLFAYDSRSDALAFDQRLLLTTAPSFDLCLTPLSRGAVRVLLLPYQSHGPAGSRVAGALAIVMLLETADEIGRYARVEGAVATAQNVTVIHSSVRADIVVLPCKNRPFYIVVLPKQHQLR
jgi:hypothetical protein